MRPVSRTWIASLMIVLFVVLMLQSTVGMTFGGKTPRAPQAERVQDSAMSADHLIKVHQPTYAGWGAQVGI